MKILGNLSRGFIPLQNKRLYIFCILLIALYKFQLWYYNKGGLNYSFRVLRKMQWRAVLWISDAFWISLTVGNKAILGLIPIHLKELYGRFYLRDFSLLSNHIIKSIISTERSNEHIAHHPLSLNKLMSKQQSQLHSTLIDIDNKYNEFLPAFSSFNREFSLKKRLIDSYSD